MRQNGVRSNVRFPYGSGMKKGGKAKKQLKDREHLQKKLKPQECLLANMQIKF